ncbi:hypothetical protein [Bradyrhizobium sp. CER78]|uniref:hypothetical protein n=1 Tax=Bradyrhizobium sp. CER78 TaxID=3039162 RepID=UPI00244919B1|nr:hypothetical protein [Bradyrhizobium sp. CER78]MDH2384632.1 hypothetical protein [Bradyrhizobium sp. CER78]
MDQVQVRSLRDVIAVLIEQRNIVRAANASFAAHLLDLAIMQLRLNVNDISAEELTGLSDFVGAEFARDKSSH